MPKSIRTGSSMLAPDPLRGQRMRGNYIAGHFGRVGERLARQAIARNPTLATQGAFTVARKLGVPHAAAAKALRTGSALRWRPLSGRAAALVRARARHMPARLTRGDTAGLSPDGLTYVIEDGDTGMKIASKLVGDPNRWRELLKTNPSKKSAKYGIAVYTGQTLVLPPEWVQEIAPEAPSVTAAQILASKATLKAWSVTDGANEAGPTDYGTRPEDLSAAWGPRDRLMLQSFANWQDKSSDGELTQAWADALAAWAESAARRASPVPLPPVIPSPSPATPTPPSMPPEVPNFPAPEPTAPQLPPADVAPEPPPLPTVPVTPVTPSLPIPPGPVAPTPVPAEPKKSSAAPLAAVAAALGFLLL